MTTIGRLGGKMVVFPTQWKLKDVARFDAQKSWVAGGLVRNFAASAQTFA